MKRILVTLSLVTALFLLGVSINPNDIPPGPMAVSVVSSVITQ